MDDDDDDDDGGDNGDNKISNGNDHVLKENDNVDNRPEHRKASRADKDVDSGEATKKQKIIETHIDEDGNEGNTIIASPQLDFQ